MKRGTTSHPKMTALATRLKIPQAHAVGILQMLWEWSANFSPAGDIGKWPDENIAAAVGWKPSDVERLMSALLDPTGIGRPGWIDSDTTYRLIIHDWPHHAEDSVHAKLARMKEFFCDGSTPKLTGLRKLEMESAKVFYESKTRLQRVANPDKTNSLAYASTYANASANIPHSGAAHVAVVADCFDRHHKRGNRETRDLVVPMVAGMELDWNRMGANHRVYCEFWDGKWQYATETFLAWVRNGMQLPPERKEASSASGPTQRAIDEGNRRMAKNGRLY